MAQHYQWALDALFNDKQHSHVILVEDDMLFAVDFLRYFEATATLLDVDPTLWCSPPTLNSQHVALDELVLKLRNPWAP